MNKIEKELIKAKLNYQSCTSVGSNSLLLEEQVKKNYLKETLLTCMYSSIIGCTSTVDNTDGLLVYRLHTAILNRPLSSAATKKVQGPDTT